MSKIRIHPSCGIWLTGLFAIARQTAMSYIVPILFHELCHVAALLMLGRSISLISLGASGLCINVRGALSYRQQAVISASGPLGSIILYLILHRLSPVCATVSLSLGIINLLPLSSFDGRGILYPFLANTLGVTKCESICRVLDIAGTVILTALALTALVLTRANTSVMLLAIYLFSLTFLKNDGIF